MAVIIGNSPAGGVVAEEEFFSVWAKRDWGSTWQRIPFLMAETSIESASPGDSEARLRWEIGEFVNLWTLPGNTLLPLNLENWIVSVQTHTMYRRYLSWIGIVIGETMTHEGTMNNGLPVGIQDLEARGLEYLLERRVVMGTFVGDGESWTYLPRTRDFNVSMSRREKAAGNRSNVRHADAGCFMFQEGGSRWSNYDIAEYILACFQPWYPIGEAPGGSVSLTPLFRLTGQTDALRYLYGEYRFHGKTIRECLNQLIDRRRGFGWHLQTDGTGPIWIRVYSLSEYPIVGRSAYIPPNPSQGYIPIGADHFVGVTYNITSMRQVDEIVCESDEPIKVMATLGFGDGSIERGWTPELETEYQEALSDDARAVDHFAAVYSRFQIPKSFPWTDWAPYVDRFAQVDVTGYGSWWHHDCAFLRMLPLEETGVGSGGETQYIEPLVFLEKENRYRELARMLLLRGLAPYSDVAAIAATNPEITEEEFLAISTDNVYITVEDLNAVLVAEAASYVQLDRTMDLDMPSCSLQLGDTGLSFSIRSKANHVFAKGWFEGGSDTGSSFDFTGLLATMFWETDMMPRVRIPVWNSTYRDSFGRVVGESNPQGRTVHIVVPGREVWVVGTGAVVAVEEGVPVFWNEGVPGIIRDDTEDIWWAALVAYVWYGQPRGAVSVTVENQVPWFRIGDLVRGTVNGYWIERLGTTVTMIQRNYREGWQIMRTGYGELDPADVAASTGAAKR